MTDLKTKLNQMFILGLEGNGYKKVLPLGLGGVILFTKDIKSIDQIKNLTSEIKNKSSITPFISIDQEGGRVERTQNIHNGKKYLSAKFAYGKGLDFLKEQTEQIAHELNEYGFNLNFAPCVDTNTNPDNPIIGERAFSNVPDKVTEAGILVKDTYIKNKIIPCIKHFPGHGDANSDSHLTLPIIDKTLKEMEEVHIKPFKEIIKNGIDMVMVAHLHCTCFEEKPIPTSLSKNTIDYLKNKLGFNGIMISDDMVMKGVSDFGDIEACIMGLRAGLNMFIYRYSDKKTLNIIDKVYETAQNDKELELKITDSYDKIIKLKEKYNMI